MPLAIRRLKLFERHLNKQQICLICMKEMIYLRHIGKSLLTSELAINSANMDKIANTTSTARANILLAGTNIIFAWKYLNLIRDYTNRKIYNNMLLLF